jgi:spore germination protein YaaH
MTNLTEYLKTLTEAQQQHLKALHDSGVDVLVAVPQKPKTWSELTTPWGSATSLIETQSPSESPTEKDTQQ